MVVFYSFNSIIPIILIKHWQKPKHGRFNTVCTTAVPQESVYGNKGLSMAGFLWNAVEKVEFNTKENIYIDAR